MSRRRFLAGLLVSAAAPAVARAGLPDANPNVADLDWLIERLRSRYAYLADRHVDLARLRAIYAPQAASAVGKRAFLGVLEQVLAELHDHHIGANTNSDDSPQLVPTGAEIWAGMRDGRAIIEQVRPGGEAARAGLLAGQEVVWIGDETAAAAVAARAPRALASPDPEALDYTLRVLLAGNHRAERVLTVRGRGQGERRVVLPPHHQAEQTPVLAVRRMDRGVVCLRVGNSLGDSGLVAAFDEALAASRDARGLILDLRDTPSGGDTDVAEPILGRFITRRAGYQRIFDPAPGATPERNSVVRTVEPRGPFPVTLPLAVLVDRWTGSMGEGMAIGLDGMKRARVVGTRMAGLCGAIEGFTLPASGIGVNFPIQRLYHLDGTPRERWRPPAFVDLARSSGEDPILERALKLFA